MNTDLPKQAQCYGLYDEDKIIGFCGVIHQMSVNRKLKRVTRLVILPDYQGIGLGTKFLESIAKIYIEKGYDFSIVTSAKNLIYSLKKKENWCLINYGIRKKATNVKLNLNRTARLKCKTASFFYKR